MPGVGSLLVTPIRLIIVMSLGLGCTEDIGLVEIQGVTRNGPDGLAIGQVQVTALDLFEEELEQTQSREDGWFRLAIPRGTGGVHVRLEGPGLRTSVFSGDPGENPRIRVPNSHAIVYNEESYSALSSKWDGCPGLNQGGMIIGRLEIADFTEENGEPLLVSTGDVRVQFPDETVRRACYVGESGLYDPDATESGPTGEFLVPNVPAGAHLVVVSWNPVASLTLSNEYIVWLGEGHIAPRYPLLVDPPIDVEP